jgi:O-antigen ligase
LENPNDFATHLLIALPFCLLMMLNAGRFSLMRIIGLVGLAGVTLTIVRAGSRGGLIALVVVLMLLIWKGTGGQRVALLGIFLACAGIAAAVFPQVLWDRFKTIISSESTVSPGETLEEAANTVELAEASIRGRWYVLQRSLEYTIRNPLFGVGPGNFPVAEADAAKALGRRPAWMETHNSYTQASSEGGIPAFLFFTAALVSAIRINAKIHRLARNNPQLRSVANIALCLMLALTGFGVNILFSHLIFRYYLPMLVGATIAFSHVAEREIQAAGVARRL